MDRLEERLDQREATQDGETEEVLPKLKTMEELDAFNNRLQTEEDYKNAMVRFSFCLHLEPKMIYAYLPTLYFCSFSATFLIFSLL